MDRPKALGTVLSSKSSEAIAKLLGVRYVFEGVAFTKDEFTRLKRLYEFSDDDSGILEQAGTDRNLIRHAKCDGLRIMAFLSKFLEPGEDPVKFLARVLVEACFDVDPADSEWSEEK